MREHNPKEIVDDIMKRVFICVDNAVEGGDMTYMTKFQVDKYGHLHVKFIGYKDVVRTNQPKTKEPKQ